MEEAAVGVHLVDLTQVALRTAPPDPITPEATLPLLPAILPAVATHPVVAGAHQDEAPRADPPPPEAHPEVEAPPPEDQDHHLDQEACLEPELIEELRKWQFTPMLT